MADIIIRRSRTYKHIDTQITKFLNSVTLFPPPTNKMKPETVILVDGLSPEFHAARMLYQSKSGIKAQATLVSKGANNVCRDKASHFIKGLKDDVKDGYFFASDFPFYGISASHPVVPDMKSEEQIDSVSSTVVDGEALRILDGRPANDRVARVAAALVIRRAKEALKILKTKDFKDAEVEIKRLAGIAIPILLTASNEIEGGYDTLSKPQQREYGGLYGLVYISVGEVSTIEIHFEDFDTGESLEDVTAEVDETGASCISNSNGDGTIKTIVFNAIHINSTRVEYDDDETALTIAEGSNNAITIRLKKTPIPV